MLLRLHFRHMSEPVQAVYYTIIAAILLVLLFLIIRKGLNSLSGKSRLTRIMSQLKRDPSKARELTAKLTYFLGQQPISDTWDMELLIAYLRKDPRIGLFTLYGIQQLEKHCYLFITVCEDDGTYQRNFILRRNPEKGWDEVYTQAFDSPQERKMLKEFPKYLFMAAADPMFRRKGTDTERPN